MSGYSATPLIKKLGIKSDSEIIFIDAPAGFISELNISQTKKISSRDISMIDHTSKKFDYVHFFTKDNTSLEKIFSGLKLILEKDGSLWISWPKKSSGVKSDLDENIIREIGLRAGLVDVKVAAIDGTWSGLKFVYRKIDR
ncbi:MAG TPA: DUF3052 domain-containing protein [Patescibacteria group bacterium]|nr:DUF3052 domain-containing protein [Patescibacteria group bacterium]